MRAACGVRPPEAARISGQPSSARHLPSTRRPEGHGELKSLPDVICFEHLDVHEPMLAGSPLDHASLSFPPFAAPKHRGHLHPLYYSLTESDDDGR